MVIGVLALQGAFAEHIQMLETLGVSTKEIRNRVDLSSADFDGLILPGGESTTMGRLLQDLHLFESLQQLIQNGLPVFGTCAGMILLANKISASLQVHLQSMEIEVVRNGYGRQLGSFNITGKVGSIDHFPMVFIRAPYIKHASDNVQVLAKVDDRIVAVQQENRLACSFHPELTQDDRLHRYFIELCEKAKLIRLKA